MTNLYSEERRLIREYEEAHRAYMDTPPVGRAKTDQPIRYDRVNLTELRAAEARLAAAKTELHRFWKTHSKNEEAGR